jgi:hypothetical protein
LAARLDLAERLNAKYERVGRGQFDAGLSSIRHIIQMSESAVPLVKASRGGLALKFDSITTGAEMFGQFCSSFECSS